MNAYHICVVQPPGYLHHRAFDEIVALFRFSIAALGIPCSVAANFISRQRTNIIVGCHLMPDEDAADIPPASIIVNTEPLFSRQNPAWTERIVRLTMRHRLWDYNERNIQRLRQLGASNLDLVRIGYQAELAQVPQASSQDIDVLFYGSLNERRSAVIEELRSRGLNAVHLFGVYGKERDGCIARAKVVLNMHYYDQNIFEVVRVFYLLTNGKAVVAEVGPDTSVENRFLTALRAAPYEKLSDACEELVADEKARRKLESDAATIMTSWPQADFMRPLLAT